MKAVLAEVENTLDNWVSETHHHLPCEVLGRKTGPVQEEIRSGCESQESEISQVSWPLEATKDFEMLPVHEIRHLEPAAV